MGIEHVNRKGDRYLLQSTVGKNGKPRLSFTRTLKGVAVDRLPEGYEIYERPQDGQVFLRKILKTAILPAERALVEAAIRRDASDVMFLLEAEPKALVVHTADCDPDASVGLVAAMFPMDSATARRMKERMISRADYEPMLRFTLVDAERRSFTCERWCFLGSIDDWHFLDAADSLTELLDRYVRHLGRESFFELT